MKLNRKITTWFIGILLGLLVLWGLWYWYTHRSPTQTNGSADNLPRTTIDSGMVGGTVRNPTETGGAEDAVPNEPVLFQIHDKPILSAVTLLKKEGPTVRFMEQGSGNVFDYNFANKQKIRVSNTSIPQIGAATWSADGHVVAFQYLDGDSVHTAVGLLASTTIADQPFDRIYFFPEGIRSIALSPDGKKLAYISNTSGVGSLIISNADGSSPKVFFTSPLQHWHITWPSSDYLILSSSYGEEGGISYRVDVRTGALVTILTSRKVFEGVLGNPEGQFAAPSAENSAIALYDQKFGTFSKLIEPTWLDKCSWVTGATSTLLCAIVPRTAFNNRVTWTRGEFTSNDILVAANFGGGFTQIIIPEDAYGDRAFDMENVLASPDKKYAVFKNRTDGLLWGVNIPSGIE